MAAYTFMLRPFKYDINIVKLRSRYFAIGNDSTTQLYLYLTSAEGQECTVEVNEKEDMYLNIQLFEFHACTILYNCTSSHTKVSGMRSGMPQR